MMDDHMGVKEVFSVNTLHGCMDNIQYELLLLKDTDYTINIMSNDGGFLVSTVQKGKSDQGVG